MIGVLLSRSILVGDKFPSLFLPVLEQNWVVRDT